MDPLLELLSPPAPVGLVTIRGPLYVEPSSLEPPIGMVLPSPGPLALGPPIGKINSLCKFKLRRFLLINSESTNLWPPFACKSLWTADFAR